MSIPVFKPSIRRRDMHSVLSCLITDVIGPAVIAEDLAASVSGEYGFEGGLALREYVRAVGLIFEALALGKGDAVILSPLSPPAYSAAIRARGLVPVFADVNSRDACIDPESAAAAAADQRARALIVHAPLGRVPDMAALAQIGLPLIADIGEALGARDNQGCLGASCRCLLVPMEPDGVATAGGGTLALAGEKADLQALRRAAETLTPDAFLPDLNASLGLVQWREYPEALEARDLIDEVYRKALMNGRHRTLISPPQSQGGEEEQEQEEARAVPYSFPVVLASGMGEVRRYARKKGVETLPAFADRILDDYPEAAEHCPNAKSLMMSTLLFPLYPTLGKKNVQLVAKVLSTLP